jgi:hypothetical protein
MKTLPKKLLPLTLFAIAVTSLFSVRPAQGFTVTLEQMGSNVVANGSGAFNLTGLTFQGSGGANPSIGPNGGFLIVGPSGPGSVDDYRGHISGPASFGSGGTTSSSGGNGNFVGIFASLFAADLLVPQGYVSGNLLSDTSTYNNASFASLGLTPGTYEWTWGTGANQNFTLVIEAVPDGGSTVSLLGCALLGLAALRRKLSC